MEENNAGCRHRPKNFLKNAPICKYCEKRIKADSWVELLSFLYVFIILIAVTYFTGFYILADTMPLVFIVVYIPVTLLSLFVISFYWVPYYEVDEESLPVNRETIAYKACPASCRHKPAFSPEYITFENRVYSCKYCGKRIQGKFKALYGFLTILMFSIVHATITTFIHFDIAFLRMIIWTTLWVLFLGIIGPLIYFYLFPFVEAPDKTLSPPLQPPSQHHYGFPMKHITKKDGNDGRQ